MKVKLKCSMKTIVIINIYRLPAILSNGPKYSLTQYNIIEGKIKTINEYRKEIQYLKDNNNIDNIIIAGDFNQYIGLNEIQHFFIDIGVIFITNKIILQ